MSADPVVTMTTPLFIVHPLLSGPSGRLDGATVPMFSAETSKEPGSETVVAES